jgi:hypothetical protein
MVTLIGAGMRTESCVSVVDIDDAQNGGHGRPELLPDLGVPAAHGPVVSTGHQRGPAVDRRAGRHGTHGTRVVTERLTDGLTRLNVPAANPPVPPVNRTAVGPGTVNAAMDHTLPVSDEIAAPAVTPWAPCCSCPRGNGARHVGDLQVRTDGTCEERVIKAKKGWAVGRAGRDRS